jgi:hypothetical protein
VKIAIFRSIDKCYTRLQHQFSNFHKKILSRLFLPRGTVTLLNLYYQRPWPALASLQMARTALDVNLPMDLFGNLGDDVVDPRLCQSFESICHFQLCQLAPILPKNACVLDQNRRHVANSAHIGVDPSPMKDSRCRSLAMGRARLDSRHRARSRPASHASPVRIGGKGGATSKHLLAHPVVGFFRTRPSAHHCHQLGPAVMLISTACAISLVAVMV